MSADFKNPELHLMQADARAIAALVSDAADLTLVVNGDDIITDISHNLDPSLGAGMLTWRGLPIEDVVRSSSRPTLRKALGLARDGVRAGRFDVNHLITGGRDLPVEYSAFGIGGDGRIMLLGRDLRLVADLQSKLLASRQSMAEQARIHKQAESQYRLLFETAADALVMVDARTGKIRDANPRAARILGVGTAGAAGRKFASLFDRPHQAAVQSMLASVLASGNAATLRVDRDGEDDLALAAELFRAGDLKLIMVRLTAPGPTGTIDGLSESGIETLVRNAAEAVVLTGEDGSVLWCNEAFLALAGIPLAVHAVGKPLYDFFEWSAVELDMLLQNVRRHGRVPTFSGTVRGANGQATAVDLSAVSMPDRTPPGFGFVMRALPAEATRSGRGNSDLTRTAENLVEMIGRVPMKDLVRDSTDVIERMCIEAALRLTGNNRASAARVLGLSRQALYLKMNRFGITDSE